MSAGVESLSNTDDVVAAVDEMAEERETRHQDIKELDETRQQLETAPEPDHVLDTDAKREPEGTAGYEMTQTRRVGTVSIHVDGVGNVRFGKPSGRAGTELLGRFGGLKREGKTMLDQMEYAWVVLEEWAVDDEHDADFWADSIAGVDAISLCRDMAMGGNVSRR